jgi:hypothetical protein
MTAFDSLAEHHRQRALRRLPHGHAIEGPYSAEPATSWGDRAVAFGAFVIFVWLVLS